MSPHDMWRRLARAVHEIYNHNSSSLSYEENFRYAYIFVLHNHGDILYEGITHLLKEHLAHKCKDQIVPAFPPERNLSPLADTLIDTIPTSKSQARASGSSSALDTSKASNKGKGKARVNDLEDEQANTEGAVTSLPSSNPVALVTFDRADAITIAQAGEYLLKAVRNVWDDHCACTSTLSKVLNYVVCTSCLGLSLCNRI